MQRKVIFSSLDSVFEVWLDLESELLEKWTKRPVVVVNQLVLVKPVERTLHSQALLTLRLDVQL